MRSHPVALAARSVTAALLLATAAATVQVEQPVMRARVDAELHELATLADAPPAVDTTALAQLPEPVRRYLAYTRLDPSRPARHAQVRFTGEVRSPQIGGGQGIETSTPWMAMRGTQTMALTARGLGHVWDTHWTNPRFAVDVRDRHVNGQTHIWAVRDDGQVLIDEGDPAMAGTYLSRFFAEATQAPAMLLPGPHFDAATGAP